MTEIPYKIYKPTIASIAFTPMLFLLSILPGKMQEGLITLGCFGVIWDLMQLNNLQEHQKKFIQENTKKHLISTQSEKFIYTVKPLLEDNTQKHLDEKIESVINKDIGVNTVSIIAGGIIYCDSNYIISTCATLFAIVLKFITINEMMKILYDSPNDEYKIIKYNIDSKLFDSDNSEHIALLNSQE